eukprot:6714186-Prymnesium_polylepis.1
MGALIGILGPIYQYPVTRPVPAPAGRARRFRSPFGLSFPISSVFDPRLRLTTGGWHGVHQVSLPSLHRITLRLL